MEEKNNIPAGATEPGKTKIFLNKIMPRILPITGIVLVVSIIGLGAILAGHVWDPSWSPFKKQPSHKAINVETIEAKIFKK